MRRAIGRNGRRAEHDWLGSRFDGLVIVDAWESADQWRAMAASEEFRNSLAELGLPEPQVEFGELINVFRTEQVAG